ncbi:MAG: MmcQ/YjbR family DNA-binding protein [Rhizobiaceae bacterium]
MNFDDLQRLALALPEAEEKSHFEKPDFRVRDKIFASLKSERFAVLKLKPEEQTAILSSDPDVFNAAPGSWGKQGWTEVFLPDVEEASLKSALRMAWKNVAPKLLFKQLD